jgi:type III secretory pathway component EscS
MNKIIAFKQQRQGFYFAGAVHHTVTKIQLRLMLLANTIAASRYVGVMISVFEAPAIASL